MLFNSVSFLVFFLVVFAGNYLLREHFTMRFCWLLLASYFFYASWNSYFLVLIVISTLIDYVVGRAIDGSTQASRKKIFLTLSLLSNLGILFVFKYFNFFIDSAAVFFESIGLPFQYSSLSIILPVGISFYTFQSMSYSIDVYRGKLSAERDLVKFALYVSFFPQLVAGPIVRSTDFFPQLATRYKITKLQFLTGAGLIWIGLVKKVVFADFFARYSDSYFNFLESSHSWFDVFVATYSFAFQIYFDFSGYTDTAIGAALLLGIVIPRNFNYPYSAVSFSDFWRRWHISLSSWMRDYIYIPLGGNRNNQKNRNIMLTMLLSGLWHGAAWNFVIWGFLHGLLVSVENVVKHIISTEIPIWMKRLLVFHLVCLCWIFFRVNSISDIATVVGDLTTPVHSMLAMGTGVALALAIVFYLYQGVAEKYSAKTVFFALPGWIQIITHGVLLMLVYLLGQFGTPFIYFQF